MDKVRYGPSGQTIAGQNPPFSADHLRHESELALSAISRHQAARSTRVSISLRSIPKSIGLFRSVNKRGDGYLRRLLVNSAHTVLLCSKTAKADPWLTSLRGRKPRLVVAVALANKTARVAWAVMSRQDTYRPAAGAALTCGAAESLREQKYVMAPSVDPTDRKKPGRLRGTQIPTN